MNSVKDVIRIWCERLDAWFLPASSPPMPPENSRVGGLRAADSGATRFASGGFTIELDDVATSLILRTARSFTALVGSRLGHDPQLHWEFGQFLMRSVRQARYRRTVLLVADGSAVEPWARHASKLTGVTLLRVGFEKRIGISGPQIRVRFPGNLDVTRDEGVITMVDRIDALYVRRGGRIEDCLTRRLEQTSCRSVRVGITAAPECASLGLIDTGAVGWFDSEPTAVQKSCSVSTQDAEKIEASEIVNQPFGSVPAVELSTARDWIDEPDQWLVHCTRASKGPWPDETLTQYRDAILTCDRWVAERTALDSLCRIIHSGEILSSAIVSSRKYRVVCWSAVPLLDLLRQRCFRSHVQRWDYEPYGLAIRVKTLSKLGGRPVIYGQPADQEKLAASDRFRHQSVGKSGRWCKEKEWRLPQSLSLATLDPSEVRVFALDSIPARERLANLPWKRTFLQHEKKRASKKTAKDGLSEIWKTV